MIKELIDRIEFCHKAYQELIAQYPDKMPKEFYEKAKDALFNHTPYKAEQLCKLLNIVAEIDIFPENGLTYERLLDLLKSRENEIFSLIEKSKDKTDFIGINAKNIEFKTHELIPIAIDQIKTTAELVLMWHQMAKTNHETGFYLK